MYQNEHPKLLDAFRISGFLPHFKGTKVKICVHTKWAQVGYIFQTLEQHFSKYSQWTTCESRALQKTSKFMISGSGDLHLTLTILYTLLSKESLFLIGICILSLWNSVRQKNFPTILWSYIQNEITSGHGATDQLSFPFLFKEDNSRLIQSTTEIWIYRESHKSWFNYHRYNFLRR